jgi:hypothetical protein
MSDPRASGQSRDQNPPANQPMKPGDQAPPGTPGTGENVCHACGGSGRKDGGSCPSCQGTGTVITGISGA